jgi:hypothetical protein
MNTPVHPPISGLIGDLRIYSAPRALIRHIQWSLNQIFAAPLELEWHPQRLAAGTFATEYQWRDSKPSASLIASTLKSWSYIAAHRSWGYIRQ